MIWPKMRIRPSEARANLSIAFPKAKGHLRVLASPSLFCPKPGAKLQLVLTYGLRYSLLQPPYETTGTQVAPSISLDNFFNQRAAAMSRGQTYNPTISFGLSGASERPFALLELGLR